MISGRLLVPEPYKVGRRMVPLRAHPVPHTGTSHPPLWWESGCAGRPPLTPHVLRQGWWGFPLKPMSSMKPLPPVPPPHLVAVGSPMVASGAVGWHRPMVADAPGPLPSPMVALARGTAQKERGGPQAGSHAAAAATSRRHAPVEHLAPTPPGQPVRRAPHTAQSRPPPKGHIVPNPQIKQRPEVKSDRRMSATGRAGKTRAAAHTRTGSPSRAGNARASPRCCRSRRAGNTRAAVPDVLLILAVIKLVLLPGGTENEEEGTGGGQDGAGRSR